MVAINYNEASVLFPAKKNASNKGGVGANFVTRKGKSYIASVHKLSLNLKAGDRVAVIGLNGSGKSTMLRLSSGIYAPNEGSVEIIGQPSTLFSTTVGLSIDASAEKNIRDGATLLNVPREEIEDLVTEIIEFAELQKYAHLPMRIYSSGMRARMGFGLATCHSADILLIDEVFGTGDQKFYEKAKLRLEKKMEKASILMMASHSEHIIRTFCNKALWMHQGELREFGDIDPVLKEYSKLTNSKT